MAQYILGACDRAAVFHRAFPESLAMTRPCIRLMAMEDVIGQDNEAFTNEQWKAMIVLASARMHMHSPNLVNNLPAMVALLGIEAFVAVENNIDNVTLLNAQSAADLEGLAAAIRALQNRWRHLAGDQALVVPAGELAEVVRGIAALIPDARLPGVLQLGSVLASTMISIAKRGTVSDDFLNKATDGTMSDMNLTIHLNAEAIKMLYNNAAPWLTPAGVQASVVRWGLTLPVGAMRLSLIIQRAAGSGLTGVLLVAKVMSEYQDFPWHRLAMMPSYAREFENFRVAITDVDGNMFYAFRREATVARQTLYPSIVYLAKRILIVCGGQQSLDRFAGSRQGIKDKAVLDAMMQRYQENRLARMDDPLAPAIDAEIAAPRVITEIRAQIARHPNAYLA